MAPNAGSFLNGYVVNIRTHHIKPLRSSAVKPDAVGEGVWLVPPLNGSPFRYASLAGLTEWRDRGRRLRLRRPLIAARPGHEAVPATRRVAHRAAEAPVHETLLIRGLPAVRPRHPEWINRRSNIFITTAEPEPVAEGIRT